MESSLREKALLAAIGVVVLYAIAVLVWFFSAESAWQRAAKKYRAARDAYQAETRLIGRKAELERDYEAEKASMPVFDFDKATATTWRRTMERIAASNRVVITSSGVKDEIESDDVLQLPIEVKSWEGSLEALVRMMHEFENTSEGLFDIKELAIKPNSSKKGYLRGSFTLNCAYMREK